MTKNEQLKPEIGRVYEHAFLTDMYRPILIKVTGINSRGGVSYVFCGCGGKEDGMIHVSQFSWVAKCLAPSAKIIPFVPRKEVTNAEKDTAPKVAS